MKRRFLTQGVVVAASLLLAACGTGPSPGSSTLPPTTAQSLLRAPASVGTAATPTPTPNPCYCPPIPHHMCPDIACMSADATSHAPAVTPSPTPVPPCYCPPGRHACPQCVVSEARTPRLFDVAETREVKARSPGRTSAA